MSRSGERKRLRELLAEYSLMSNREVAAFLGCSLEIARGMVNGGVIPSVQVGAHRKVDPLDAVVHVLAGRARMTTDEYWELHGEATPEYAIRYFKRIQKLLAAT